MPATFVEAPSAEPKLPTAEHKSLPIHKKPIEFLVQNKSSHLLAEDLLLVSKKFVAVAEDSEPSIPYIFSFCYEPQWKRGKLSEKSRIASSECLLNFQEHHVGIADVWIVVGSRSPELFPQRR